MRKRFFFHFNKPKTQQRGKTTWSVHFNKQCHFVDEIICNVPTSSKNNSKQPRAIIIGWAKNITIIPESDKYTVAVIE